MVKYEMSGKTLVQMESPITQSVGAVKSLLALVGRASDPLPTDVSLDNGRLVLVLSNKKDAYYTCTATACSCPSAHWHNGPCKHQRKFFSEIKAAIKATDSEPLIKRGGFRPIDLLPSEEKARAAPLYVDTTPDVSPREVAYHSIQEDKILWPAEA
jgi:hypothetical protein